MREKNFLSGLALTLILMLILTTGCVQQDSKEEYCTKNGTRLSLSEAREIASKSECAKAGTLKNVSICNNYTGIWWIDLTPFTERKGCNPACVVDVKNKTADVNWRCTGLIVP